MIAGTLEIQLLANMARLHADMSSAKNSVGGAMASIEKSVERAKAALGGLAGGIGLTQVIAMVDKYAKFTAQLKLATDSASAYATAMNDVRRISKVAQADIEATGVLYARIAMGTRELGVTQQRVSKITEAVNLALRVSGATAAESASAQLQLSQAFASGTLRGEEFNAVNEAAPRLMRALADGMGVPVGALKAMATEGKITSEVMANALPRALAELNEEAKSVMTISGAFTSLKNEVLLFVGTQAQASGSVSILTSGIAALANNLSLLAGVLLTVAASKFAQWIAAGATALYTQAAASAAATAATLAKANADVAATGSAAALTAARVAELRASVLSASGSAALAITTNGLVPAQARAAAASAAHSAALVAQTAAMGGASIAGRVLSGVMAFFGGPIGLVITALGIAATAWATWGRSAVSGNKEAAESTEISSVSILASLDKQIEKLNERLALAKQGNADLAKEGGPNAEKLSGYLAEVNRLKAMGNTLTSIERIQLVEQQGLYDGLSAKLGLVRTKTAEVAAVGQQSKAAEWMEKLANKTEKMNSELEKARKELGGAFSPEIERRIRAQYEEKAKGAGAAAAAVKKEISAYASLSASVRSKIEESNLALSIGNDASEAQRIRIKLDQEVAAGKVAMTAAHRAALDLDLDALEVSQKAQQLAKDEIEFYAEQAKARHEASGAAVKAATEEAQKNEELARTFGMTKTAIDALELARLEERRAQIGNIDECTRETAELEALIDAKKRSMTAVSIVDALELAKKSNEEMTKDWDDTVKGYDDIFRKGFAGMVNGGKGAWKSFTQSLVTTFKTSVADQIYKMFAQPFVMKLVASLLGVTGGAAAGVANAATGSSGIMGGLSNLSSLKTIGSVIGNGITQTIANVLPASLSASLGLTSTALATSNAALIGGGASASAAASAAAAAGNATAMGGFGSAMAAIPGVGWAALAAVAVASIFGGRGKKEATGGGIEGNFSGAGFAGNSFSTWKQDGGWFHSDRTGKDTSGLDAATTKQFSSSYQAVKSAASSAALALGLSADAVTNYSQAISLQLGKDAAENEKAVAALFSGIGDSMASAVAPGIAQLAKDGETAGGTLSRLAGSLTTANAWLDRFGTAMLQVSLAGGDAASKLADLFGGLENLSTASAAFYATYFTEAERAAQSTDDMSKALGALGLALPASKEEFRALALSMDQTSDAGRTAYAALLMLAPEFATTTDALAAMATQATQAIESVFSKLSDGIKSAIESIAGERVAVAAATLQINNPGTMSRDAILRGIAGTALATPGNAGLSSAQSALSQADAVVAAQAAAAAWTQAQTPSRAALDAAGGALGAAQNATRAAQAQVDSRRTTEGGKFAWWVDQGLSGNSPGFRGGDMRWGENQAVAQAKALLAARAAEQSPQAAYDAQAAAYSAASAANAVQVAAAQARLTAATAAQAAAVTAARTAQLDYIASLQDFSIDASKAASKLGTLREETLKYYDAQKQLADLMTTSAAGLRSAVAAARTGQLDPAQSLAQQQGGFSAAYGMALATSGAAQAGYADRLTAALPGLSTALMDAASTREEWARATGTLFAQSQAIAQQLEASAPQDYAVDSLAMLGQIDAALMMLDASSKSAEKIVADAVKAGTESNANGFRAMIAALTGQAIPAFAAGGSHSGGLRIVGERGWEVESTGPSHIFNQQQLGQALRGGGSSDEVVQELRALRQEVAGLRAEAQATAGHTSKTARLLDRAMPDGDALATRAAV